MVLKVCREFDDVTSAGKLFHVRAAATGNARSPTVDSRVDGTSSADVDDGRRNAACYMFEAYVTPISHVIFPYTAVVTETTVTYLKCLC